MSTHENGEQGHTAGPWSVGYGGGITGPRVGPVAYWEDQNGALFDYLPISAAGGAVAWLVISLGHGGAAALTPDANLISAGPEMLAALEDVFPLAIVFAHQQAASQGMEEPHPTHRAIIDAAAAAISKARGKVSR